MSGNRALTKTLIKYEIENKKCKYLECNFYSLFATLSLSNPPVQTPESKYQIL